MHILSPFSIDDPSRHYDFSIEALGKAREAKTKITNILPVTPITSMFITFTPVCYEALSASKLKNKLCFGVSAFYSATLLNYIRLFFNYAPKFNENNSNLIWLITTLVGFFIYDFCYYYSYRVLFGSKFTVWLLSYSASGLEPREKKLTSSPRTSTLSRAYC